MKVAELKKRLSKADDELEVIIESEKGKKFNVLTAKIRPVRVGHKACAVFWIATNKPIEWRDI